MPKFSKSSMRKLKQCDVRLQKIALKVVEKFDCTVVTGYRNRAEQNKAYKTGKSKLKYPNGKHNHFPSKAIDLAPYVKGKGISWDKDQCYYFAGYVVRVAEELGIKLRWGGDWDGDRDVNDQSFNDLVHFELAE